MIRILADECCPKVVVERLRADAFDVLSAAEQLARSDDSKLLALATADDRVILTEDFDFGDLLVRDRLPGAGAIILYLPHLAPDDRARRLADVLKSPGFIARGRLTIIEARRVRQRLLAPPRESG